MTFMCGVPPSSWDREGLPRQAPFRRPVGERQAKALSLGVQGSLLPSSFPGNNFVLAHAQALIFPDVSHPITYTLALNCKIALRRALSHLSKGLGRVGWGSETDKREARGDDRAMEFLRPRSPFPFPFPFPFLFPLLFPFLFPETPTSSNDRLTFCVPPKHDQPMASLAQPPQIVALDKFVFPDILPLQRRA
jgi:hypothetical protein